jgi:hypothetical protein
VRVGGIEKEGGIEKGGQRVVHGRPIEERAIAGDAPRNNIKANMYQTRSRAAAILLGQ